MSDVVDLGFEKRVREADAAADCTKWTPRDVLVDMVAQIDRGEVSPDCIFVTWTETNGSSADVRFSASASDEHGPSLYKQSFLVEAFRRKFWEAVYA